VLYIAVMEEGRAVALLRAAWCAGWCFTLCAAAAISNTKIFLISSAAGKPQKLLARQPSRCPDVFRCAFMQPSFGPHSKTMLCVSFADGEGAVFCRGTVASRFRSLSMALRCARRAAAHKTRLRRAGSTCAARRGRPPLRVSDAGAACGRRVVAQAAAAASWPA